MSALGFGIHWLVHRAELLSHGDHHRGPQASSGHRHVLVDGRVCIRVFPNHVSDSEWQPLIGRALALKISVLTAFPASLPPTLVPISSSQPPRTSRSHCLHPECYNSAEGNSSDSADWKTAIEHCFHNVLRQTKSLAGLCFIVKFHLRFVLLSTTYHCTIQYDSRGCAHDLVFGCMTGTGRSQPHDPKS